MLLQAEHPQLFYMSQQPTCANPGGQLHPCIKNIQYIKRGVPSRLREVILPCPCWGPTWSIASRSGAELADCNVLFVNSCQNFCPTNPPSSSLQGCLQWVLHPVCTHVWDWPGTGAALRLAESHYFFLAMWVTHISEASIWEETWT